MTDAEKIAALKDAIKHMIEVLESKEMNGVWGFLYTHGIAYSGPTVNMDQVKTLLERC